MLHFTRTFNTPPRLSQDNIYAALRTIDLTGLAENINKSPAWSTPIKQQLSPSIPYASPLLNKSLQTPTHDRPTSIMNVLHNQSNINPACLPTPNPSSPNFATRFRADVVQLVETDNKHKHTGTCYKYSNPKQGDKKICRLRMPRKLVPVSTIDPDTGHISMRRSDPWINNFNEYLIAACRSNMDIKFIWSGSDAKALVYYITDYVTKMSLSFHDTFALVQKSITSLQNSLQQTSNESAIEKSRKLVLRCYNTLASQQELSGVQVASYLMNWDDHYTTHKFQGLFLIQTERFLQTQLNETRAERKLELLSQGRPPSERYLFQNQHPQATTYLMRKYSQSHVPILYGPQIPRQDREDTRERYNRALLTLFVPWRTVADLCDVNETWEDAFKSRKNFVSMHSWQIIENIQLLHECKKDRDEHLLQVIAEAQVDTDSIDPVLLPANQDIHGEYDMDDSDDLLELLGNLDDLTAVAANATKRSTENKYIEEAIEAVENVGRFTHVNTHGQRISSESTDQIGQQLLPFVSATPNFVRLNLKYQEQLKTEKERIRRSLITGNYDKTDDTLDYDDAQDAIVTLIDPNNYNKNNIENCGSIHPVISFSTSFPTQKSIAHEFTLNREQRAAFMIITSHLDGDSGRRTDNNNGQLIMCIPGCGGTGKSQLIRAVTKYFLVTKRMQILRKLAPTGIAAAEIGGMTIHSFLGEQRNSRKPRTIKPGDLKLEKEWKLIKYLLIDEMSMVGLTLLAKLNRIICVAKCLDPQVPFGGVNVIFFGDYLQYRPVYDVPLHTDFSLPSKKKSGKLPNENEIQQRVARSLILQINCVVKLTQQMRTEDLRYLQLLERLRHGQCNHDDYELLLARVVGQPSTPSLHDSPWNKAPILVFRNEVRTQLNHKAAIHNAAQLGSTPMVCVAQDTCKGKTIEDPTLIKKLLKLSDSKTEHLPGLLPFVPGMPVILTQNIATELGLINGINGIFRQLVYQADSVSTDVLSDSFPKNTQYVRQPLYALIEIAKSKIECNLEELQPTLVPIPLMEQTFRADIADILPKDKKSKSNQKAILSIKRRALPLVPAYCITTHKSQGQTLNKVVVDLKLPNESDDIAAVYVPLSRVKRLTDLIVLRHFDYKVLLIKPSKSQLAEMQRLDKLALYKKKMNATDLKYLSKTTVPVEEDISGKGRPPNERFPFQKQHPQASTHLMIKYSEPHVPILYGPQIPRRDRDDTRERYSRALLTLFVPWRTVTDLCGANQTWEDALNSRQHLISVHSWKIIENIQLLHECKKDRDEHLLQVIAEAQVDNDAIDPGLLPANHDVHGVYDMDDSDDLLELLGNLDEYTTAAVNTTRKTTENKYIEETIEAVEKVGRFNHTNIHHQSSSDISIDRTNRQLIPFLCATPHLVQLNTKWQEQLKIEKERVRRSLITGNYDKDDDILDLFAARDAVVTVMNPNNYSTNNFENYGSILPVLKVINNFPTQTSIINEFTLNRE
ncbi:unnamed protein product [Rotaria sordida]|uniref:ATP-dependent DNA helicase n=2 Tax=Rotaria sordida TaxID=392033 RepID=A0A814C6X3_9BILA|nr:unnamed protein product [Rotaria sordida]